MVFHGGKYMLFNNSIGLLLAVASLVIGVLVLTGHGSVFFKGIGEDQRRQDYDMEKYTRASGIALLAFGVLTGIDCFTSALWEKIAYIVLIVVTFVIYLIYIQKKCKKVK